MRDQSQSNETMRTSRSTKSKTNEKVQNNERKTFRRKARDTSQAVRRSLSRSGAAPQTTPLKYGLRSMGGKSSNSKPLLDHFKYQPLEFQNDEIRLLRILPARRFDGLDCGIECSMDHVSLKNLPEYYALSYVWGDLKTIRSISLGGYPFAITANLHRALLRLRTFLPAKPIWIDAICINQRDLQERSKQVVKMGEIFKHAMIVIVWLGDEDEHSELAFCLLLDLKNCLQKKTDLSMILKDSKYLDSFYSLYRLLYRDYWWRVWVVQEVILAKSITLLCGQDSFLWSDLVAIQETLIVHYLYELDAISQKRPELDFLRVSIESRGPRAMLLSKNHSEQAPNLTQTLLKHRFKQSSNPKDLIYSLVGLSTAHGDPRFVIDYTKSICQVYTDVVEYIVATTKYLDILCAMPRGRNRHGLPSWVPDWSFDEYGSSLLEHSSKHQFSAAGVSEAETEFKSDRAILKAKGAPIAVIKAIGVPCRMVDLEDIHNAVDAFCQWQKLSQSATKDPLALAGTFCRNVLREKYQAEESAKLEKESGFLEWIVGTFTRTILTMRPGLELDSQLFAMAKHRVSWRNQEEDDVLGMILLKGIAELMFARRLFISDANLIGLGAESIMEGDIVSVLLGCQLPVILRSEDEHFIYLSEVFIDGYMYGKAMDELATGRVVLQDFTIH